MKHVTFFCAAFAVQAMLLPTAAANGFSAICREIREFPLAFDGRGQPSVVGPNRIVGATWTYTWTGRNRNGSITRENSRRARSGVVRDQATVQIEPHVVYFTTSTSEGMQVHAIYLQQLSLVVARANREAPGGRFLSGTCTVGR